MKPFGPVVLPSRLTGAVYHLFLLNDLAVLLELVPLNQRQHMRFMRDGAPTHFLRIVRQHLNLTSCEQRIGHTGPVNCPPWSPDFIHLDLWLWRHLKSLVYSALVDHLEILQQPARRFQWNQDFSTECSLLCDEELKVVLKCMRNIRSTSKDDRKIALVPSGIVLWSYVVCWLRFSCSFVWVLLCSTAPDRFWGSPNLPSNGHKGLPRGLSDWGVKLTVHLHLVPRSRKVELFFHFPIHLHGVVLNLLITETTLTFNFIASSFQIPSY
jgi:hypothetical protein